MEISFLLPEFDLTPPFRTRPSPRTSRPVSTTRASRMRRARRLTPSLRGCVGGYFPPSPQGERGMVSLSARRGRAKGGCRRGREGAPRCLSPAERGAAGRARWGPAPQVRCAGTGHRAVPEAGPGASGACWGGEGESGTPSGARGGRGPGRRRGRGRAGAVRELREGSPASLCAPRCRAGAAELGVRAVFSPSCQTETASFPPGVPQPLRDGVRGRSGAVQRRALHCGRLESSCRERCR